MLTKKEEYKVNSMEEMNELLRTVDVEEIGNVLVSNGFSFGKHMSRPDPRTQFTDFGTRFECVWDFSDWHAPRDDWRLDIRYIHHKEFDEVVSSINDAEAIDTHYPERVTREYITLFGDRIKCTTIRVIKEK